MSPLSRLSCLALRPCLPALAFAADAAGYPFVKIGVEAAAKYLARYFTDPSQELQQALGRSADRAWVCLEVALGGESILGYFTRPGADKALARQLRAFIDSNPLQLPPAIGKLHCSQALEQLRAANQERGGLKVSIAESAWTSLERHLEECHEKDESPLRAIETILGWVNALGPCYGDTDRNQAYARIGATATTASSWASRWSISVRSPTPCCRRTAGCWPAPSPAA
jgi:hypothetical protein